MIPKTVHSSWEGQTPPSLVRWCVRSMREHNPSWTVRFLDISGLALPGAIPQHRSDLERVRRMVREGGVWLDASCLCLGPLETWVDLESDALQAFSIPADDGILENWAFAARPQHRLLVLWEEELEKAHSLGFDAYCEALPESVRNGPLSATLPYLTAHAALMVARMRAPEERVVTRLGAREGGPLEYVAWGSWVSTKAVLGLWVRHPQLLLLRLTGGVPRLRLSETGGTPFWKLRGGERTAWRALEISAVALLVIFALVLTVSLARGNRVAR